MDTLGAVRDQSPTMNKTKPAERQTGTIEPSKSSVTTKRYDEVFKRATVSRVNLPVGLVWFAVDVLMIMGIEAKSWTIIRFMHIT